MFALTEASIGAATLAFAATARSIGAATSRAMLRSALRSSRDMTSLSGRAVPASAASSSLDSGGRSASLIVGSHPGTRGVPSVLLWDDTYPGTSDHKPLQTAPAGAVRPFRCAAGGPADP